MLTVKIDARNRRPGGMRQHAPQMSSPRRRQAIADDLEPERHIRRGTELPLAHHLRFSTADNEPTAHILTDARRIRRRTEVHRNWPVDDSANLFIALNIVLWNRCLKHRHVRIGCQLLQNRDGSGSIAQGTVRIQIQLEIGRHSRCDCLHLRNDVPPRSRLILETGVTLRDSIRRFRRPIFRRRINTPPRNRHRIATLRAEQLIHRHL